MGLTEDIATGKCGSFYLVTSEEEYLRVDAVRRWLAALNKRESHAVHRFRPPRWDLAELENILMTVPMFGDAIAVIIDDVERTHASRQERLISLLSRRGPHISVILTAATIDKRRKFYKGLAKLGSVESFAKIYPEKRPGWVHRIAGDLGWTISGEASVAVAELVGEDLMAYEAELKKIMLYIGNKRRIEKADIDLVLFADSRFGDFAIADAVGKKDLARALRVMRQTYSGSGSSSGWMPLLAGTLFRFLRIKAMDKGASDQGIAADLGLNPYVVKLLRPQVARFSREQLLGGLQLLYSVEKDIKTSVMSARTAAEIFLIRLLCNKLEYRAH